MKTQTYMGPGKARIEALSDGVFAIAMTLLILDLKVPVIEPGNESEELAVRLWALWPRMLAYVVSFLNLGVNWVGQHAQLHYIRRSDRIYMWCNLIYLMLISALPFSTAVLGQYPRQPLAIALYSANLGMAGLILFGQLRYADGRGKLFDPEIERDLIKWGGRRLLMGPAIYALAFVLGFVNPIPSLILCGLAPILYLIPGKVDRYWQGEEVMKSTTIPGAQTVSEIPPGVDVPRRKIR